MPIITKDSIRETVASIEAAKSVRLDGSKDTIRKAFMAYTRHAFDVLNTPIRERERKGSIAYIVPVHRLRSLVEGLEGSAKFKQVCSALVRELKKNGLRHDFVRSALENFFKRSHFYIDTFDGKKPNQDDLFECFWSSVPTRKVKITRVRPICGCWFESSRLDLGLFRIQKFTKKELDGFLDGFIDRQTREVFYPNARVDTDSLSECWLILEDVFADYDLGERVDTILDSVKRVKRDLDRKVPDRVTQLLAFHYGFPEIKFGWEGLTLPFSFEVDDDIFGFPVQVEAMPSLDAPMIPEDEDEADAVGHTYNCVEFDGEQELYLKRVVEKVQKVLNLIEAVEDWNFIVIAMGYLGKAFVTDEGLDQLLWNVVVLDALLSERDGPVMATMKPRISKILGSSEEERPGIGKQFTKLYNFRSELVHGKKYARRAQTRHLVEARELASRTLLWFIDYLLLIDRNLRHQNIPYKDYPTRRELLRALDLDKASRNSLINRLGPLPEGFPQLGNSP